MSQKFLKIKGLLINVMKTSEGLVVWLRLDGHLWCSGVAAAEGDRGGALLQAQGGGQGSAAAAG